MRSAPLAILWFIASGCVFGAEPQIEPVAPPDASRPDAGGDATIATYDRTPLPALDPNTPGAAITCAPCRFEGLTGYWDFGRRDFSKARCPGAGNAPQALLEGEVQPGSEGQLENFALLEDGGQLSDFPSLDEQEGTLFFMFTLSTALPRELEYTLVRLRQGADAPAIVISFRPDEGLFDLTLRAPSGSIELAQALPLDEEVRVALLYDEGEGLVFVERAIPVEVNYSEAIGSGSTRITFGNQSSEMIKLRLDSIYLADRLVRRDQLNTLASIKGRDCQRLP